MFFWLASIYLCIALADCAIFQQALRFQEDQRDSPFDASFDRKVEQVIDHFRIPGLAVAVVNGGVFSKGYGISDQLDSRPVTEHTLFFTGSTTKAFTSAALSLIVDDNVNYPAIQWETPVHDILPLDFVLHNSWSTSRLTIVDILSHRSGLPRHDWVWMANISLHEAVRSMRNLPFTASPRTEWQYCNLMYSVATHLIETVTNQTLKSFLKEKIWSPLNMTETYLSLADAQNDERDISQGFCVKLNDEITPTERVYTDSIRGAGNILSSVSDYSKWISTMLDHGPPFSQAGYSQLFGGHSIVLPNPIEPFQTPTLYGLGWMSQAYKGEMILYHEGAQLGYGASVMLLPQRNFGLVLLGNNMNGMAAGANTLAYHLIDEELGIPIESRYDWAARGDLALNNTRLSKEIISELYPKIPDPPLASPLNFSIYEGHYTHPAYPELKVSSECKENGRAYEVLNRKFPDLCASLTNYNDYSQDLEIGLFHVSSTYWLQIAAQGGMLSAARAEFLDRPDGSASWLGVEIEPQMARQGEKIWWRHTE